MIALKDIQKPELFDSERFTRILSKAREVIANNGKPELPDAWSKDEDLRRVQHERHHNGKCCYCERKRDIKLERDIEHYRPKLGVKGAPNHKGYWWLAYEWNNLLISCKTCNTVHKRNHFPLRDECKRVYDEGSTDEEDALLINPAIEDPEPYFIYATEDRGGEYLTKIVPSEEDSERGSKTIQVLELNRPELLGEEERSESFRHINFLIDEYKHQRRVLGDANKMGGNEKVERHCLAEIEKIKNHLKKEIRPEKTYSGFRRYLVRMSRQHELVDLLNEA